MRGSGFADDGVALFPGGVGVGMVEGVVETAAFGSLEGGLDDDFGDGGEVAEFEEVGCDDEVPVVFLDFLLEVGEAFLGAEEAFGGADDSDVVPHATADFVPVVGYDDQFVRVGGVAGLPWGDVEVDGWQVGAEGVLGGAVGADEGFEEGVAGEAIGAVEAGAGDLADGVEAGQLGDAVDGGDHAAALVVGGGHDGDGFLGDVDAVAEAGFVDVGEALDDEGGGFVGDVEEDVVGARSLHDAVDGAGDDVAGGE